MSSRVPLSDWLKSCAVPVVVVVVVSDWSWEVVVPLTLDELKPKLLWPAKLPTESLPAWLVL